MTNETIRKAGIIYSLALTVLGLVVVTGAFGNKKPVEGLGE
jgi:hypothetical protein